TFSFLYFPYPYFFDMNSTTSHFNSTKWPLLLDSNNEPIQGLVKGPSKCSPPVSLRTRHIACPSYWSKTPYYAFKLNNNNGKELKPKHDIHLKEALMDHFTE